jgi:hypothetical protein
MSRFSLPEVGFGKLKKTLQRGEIFDTCHPVETTRLISRLSTGQVQD